MSITQQLYQKIMSLVNKKLYAQLMYKPNLVSLFKKLFSQAVLLVRGKLGERRKEKEMLRIWLSWALS